MKRILIALFISVLLIDCAGSPTPIPESGSSEAMLYALRCSTCHSTPHPKRHRYKEWKVIVEVMQTHMRERRMPPLTDKERTSILAYLKVHSREDSL